MKKWIVLGVTAVALSLSSQAGAAVVTRNVSVSGADEIFRSATDGVGNVGAELAFDIRVAPFTIQAGDRIITNLVFDRPVQIQDAQQDAFWAFPTGLANLELFFFSYGYAGSNVSGISTISTALVSYSMSLDAIGNTTTTSGAGSVQTDGGGMSAAYFGDQSWTDSTFLLRGLQITTNVIDYQLVRGDGVFDSFGGSIFASRIRRLPEPGSGALVGLALMLLAAGAAERPRWASS